MSINTMVENAIKKNLISIQLNKLEIVESAAFTEKLLAEKQMIVLADDHATVTKSNVESAMTMLFAYIPTEIIALYIAVLAALGTSITVKTAHWVTFISFFIGTPIVVWLVYAAKTKALVKELPLHPGDWPKWEMFAATMAFTAWAFALPNSPFGMFVDWYSSAIASVIILITSAVLSLLAPFFKE